MFLLTCITICGVPTLPNGLRDRGQQEYIYGALINLTMKVQLSAELRSPLKAVISNGNGGNLPVTGTGVQVSMKGVAVTAFGNNPDGRGTILRLWEQAGNNGQCTVTLPANHAYKEATFCNLRGEPLSRAFKINNTIDVKVRAYEPVSILLQ